MIKDIRNICIEIKVKNKNADKTRNKQLEKLSKFVSKEDMFNGKKRKIKKLINSFKVKVKK